MKRFSIAILVAALLAQAAFAQSSSDPSEEHVLEVARAKHFAERAADAAEAAEEAAERVAEAAEERARATERDVPYTPFIVAFVPGLAVPFGYYDASISAGAIGVLQRDVLGIQVAGVMGMARQVEGFQGAGVFCIADGGVEGFQGAGVFNISSRVDGFQSAGVFNIAEDVEGFQAAGVFNVADDVDGWQVAPVINIADRVDGVQLGLINVADRIDGFQLGLINIARDPGLNSKGLYYEPETDYAYAVFQGGARRFYTAISAGMPRADWKNSAEGLTLGYGLGARFRLTDLYLDLDLSAVSLIGPELSDIGAAIEAKRALSNPAALIPYPSVRACLGLPILGRLHLVAGVKADFDLAAAPRVPAALKTGVRGASEIAGASFESWTKWYLGIKL